MAAFEEKKLAYSWRSRIPEFGEDWLNCEEVDAQAINRCKISVGLRVHRIEAPVTLQLAVRKTNPKPATVTISVILDNQLKSKFIKEWMDFCDFDFTVPRDWTPTTMYAITCTINWIFPELFPKPKEPNLCNEMVNFLMNPLFSDVTIVVGDVELPAHKVVLSCCSSVFSTMLSSPIKKEMNEEAKENRIVVNDVELDIVKIILRYMYEGYYNSFDDIDTIFKVLAASEIYDIRNLKEQCEYKLYKKLTAENVLKILDQADDHVAQKLVDICLSFITEHKEEIIKLPYFHLLCLRKPELMFQFITKVIART